MLRTLLVLCAVLAATVARADDSRPVLVELFTSQGCSSCPPADKLLGELAARPDVIALGYHIDYWDRLGWKDPFSSREGTARQRSYARLLGTGQIYTPQIVVDGVRDVVGSHRAEVEAALAASRPPAVAPVTFAADRKSVTIGPASKPGASGTALLVRFVAHRETHVAAGENEGRTLADANAVDALQTLGIWNGNTATFPLDPLTADHGVAVFVQSADGHILGAAMLRGS